MLYNARHLNPLNVMRTFMKTVDECPDYRVNFMQFRYCRTGEPVSFIEYFHISEVLIVHKHVNVFGTKQSVRNIVDGCFSELSVSWSSTEVGYYRVVLKHLPIGLCSCEKTYC